MVISSIGISALVTVDLHALNNEGSEGNQLLTRQVQIVDAGGEVHAVNAISGDMLKHGFVARLQQIALEASLPLCEPCRMLDPNRFAADEQYLAQIDGQVAAAGQARGDSTLLGLMIQRCVLDDVAGNLLTGTIGGKKRSVARKSVVEFGWAVARPETARTDSFLHAKYVPEGRGRGSGEGANLGQNIFHRPASSGQYAMVIRAEMSRLGANDYTFEQMLPENDRAGRARAVLGALGLTLISPTGAQQNTQLPHVLAVEGVVTVSPSASTPAPIFSPLQPDYRGTIRRISDQLGMLPHGRPVDVHPFESPEAYLEIMRSLSSEV